MSAKCRICRMVDVEKPGDVCEMCKLGQDPFANDGPEPPQPNPKPNNDGYDQPGSDKSAASFNRSSRRVLLNGSYGQLRNDSAFVPVVPGPSAVGTNQDPNAAQIHSQASTGQLQKQNSASNRAAKKNTPLVTGIAKNISSDKQERSFLGKWAAALFSGIPYTQDDDITTFQVFPDFMGSTMTSQGTACDQVVVYGRLTNGAISENNTVEIYGTRNSSNIIMAREIRNVDTGAVVTPQRAFSAALIRMATLLLFSLIAAAVLGIGIKGLIIAAVVVFCLFNLPLVIKVVSAIISAVFSLIRRIF